MGKIICFSNQKGGVGKTTTAINLAAFVAKKGRKSLLLDFDPQGNSTSGFGLEKNQLELTCYDFLMGDCEASDVIRPTMVENLSISLLQAISFVLLLVCLLLLSKVNKLMLPLVHQATFQ